MLSNLPHETVNGCEMTCFPSVGTAKLYLVHTMKEWKAFFELLCQQQLIACDTETSGFFWYQTHHIVGLSFGWKDKHFYIPVRHELSVLHGAPLPQLKMEEIKDDLVHFFSDTERTCIFHNAAFDCLFYRREGIEILCKLQDTTILWHFYDENAPKKLKVIASGWKDDMGREHKGLVDALANVKEKEIDQWRNKEAKARRGAFRGLVMAKATELSKDIAHQGKKRNDLKKWIAANLFQDHIYAKSSIDDIHYGVVPIPLMCEYAALDTYLTYTLYEYCVKNIKWNSAITSLYKNEIETLRMLIDVQWQGVRINPVALQKAGDDFSKQIEALHKSIKEQLGDVNLNSTLQLAEALLSKGVELTKEVESSTEENKRYALDKKVLKKLENNHTAIKDILKLRELDKLNSTYCEGILAKLGPDGILHTQLNQNVKTGRMSSSAPNLQNLPAKDKVIRRVFIPLSDEYVYLLIDYSQIELRLTAHFSQDPLLLDSYAKNQDVHSRTCCELYGFDLPEFLSILKDENHPMHEEYDYLRTVNKRTSFGIIYGVGAPGLSEQIERPAKYAHLTDSEWVDICQGYIDAYLAKYIGVKRFINQASRLVAKNAEITNYFGRVRHLPHAKAVKILGHNKWFWLEKRAQRQGTNFLVQGCQDPIAPILTVQGYIPLKDLEEKGKPPLITFSGVEENYSVLDTGIKNCVEVRTSLSTGICSDEHKFFVYENKDLVFKGINELQVGDFVVTNFPVIEDNKYTELSICSEEEAELCGILIGDGSYGIVRGTNGSRTKVYERNTLSVACGLEESWADYVKLLFEKVFPTILVRKRSTLKKRGKLNWRIDIENKEVRQRFIDLGLLKVIRDKKTIPTVFMTQPKNIRKALVRGLMDTDGGINGHCLSFINKSENVSKQLQLLLLSLGVSSRYIPVTYKDVLYHKLVIKQEMCEIYNQNVGFALKYKDLHAQKYATKWHVQSTIGASLRADACALIKGSSVWKTLTRQEKAAITMQSISKYRLQNIMVRLPQSPEVANISDLLQQSWTKIEKITPVGNKSTMDLELNGEDHSYTCRGLVQHNTAADMFKMAMVRVYNLLKGRKSKLVLCVHDEIQIYLHKDEFDLIAPIKKVMEDWKFSVPIVADISWSTKSWGDKVKL